MTPMEAVIQYLDWALIAAHAEIHKDCREVNICVDLIHKQTRTSSVGSNRPAGYGDPGILLNLIDVVHVVLTGPKKILDRQKLIALIHKTLNEYHGR